MFARVQSQWDQAIKASEEPARKAILEQQKPQEQKLRDMEADHKRLGRERQFLEQESKKLSNIFRRGDFEQDIAGIDERRKEIAREHGELDERLKKERDPYNIRNTQAPELAKQREPELYKLRKVLSAIHGEWLARDQKRWEREQQRGQDRGDGGRGGLPGRGRGDPEIER
jgi:hypothetical protein